MPAGDAATFAAPATGVGHFIELSVVPRWGDHLASRYEFINIARKKQGQILDCAGQALTFDFLLDCVDYTFVSNCFSYVALLLGPCLFCAGFFFRKSECVLRWLHRHLTVLIGLLYLTDEHPTSPAADAE